MNTFPRHDIDPKKKGEKWLLQFSKAAWDDSKGIKNKAFYHNREHFAYLKSYAMGKQNTSQYKNQFVPKDANGREGTSFVNLDYTIIPFIPKFRKIAIGKITKMNANIVATAIDALARDEENDYFADQKAKILLLEQLADIPNAQALLGIEDDDPHTLEEIDIKRKFSYKHQAAIEVEQGLKLVFTNNKYHHIEDQVVEDLFDYGVGGVKEYFDENGVIKIRHVKAKNFLCSYSEEPDFSDARFQGEVLHLTVEDIRRESGFSEDVMEEIAKLTGDRNQMNRGEYSGTSKPYDDQRVLVVDWNFKTVNDLVLSDKTNSKGNRQISKSDFSKKGKSTDKVKRINTSYEAIYKCKWIVGTNYIYSYGLETNMKRKKNSLTKTSFSYHMYAPSQDEMEFFGVVEAMIPVADQIQIAWLKLQNLVLNIVPPGIAFDFTALENVNLGHGGKAWEPMKILDLYRQRGDFPYRSRTEDGEPMGPPIQPIQNQVMGAVNDMMALINSFTNLLRDNIGFNEVTDGSTPDPRMLNGVANLAYQSTSNALDHIVKGVKYMNESVADGVTLRMQDAFAAGKVKGYRVALGASTQMFWDVQKDISVHEMSIKMEDKPDDEQKAKVEARIALAIQSGQITIADAEFLDTIDNVKERGAVLAFRVKKNAEEQQRRSLEQVQANGQVQQESAMMAEEEKRKTLQLQHQNKVVEIQVKGKVDSEIKQLELQSRLQEAGVREDGRITAKGIENLGKQIVEAMRQNKPSE